MEKTYLVLVTGFATEKVEALKEPIVLDGRPIAPPVVKLLSVEGNSARILVTIHEGRNRQVRRMCGQAGLPVQRLARVQEGNLKLGDLPAGKWRYLTEAEVDMLKGEKSDE
jgi:23S rRNA pseudouridine2605 synthase